MTSKIMTRGGGRPDDGVYRDAEGRRVPSVTQVLGETIASGRGLEQWLMRHGYEARDIRDRAARCGSLAHDAIEAAIHHVGDAPEAAGMAVVDAAFIEPELADEARGALRSWLAWAGDEGARYEWIATEVPLVSSRLRVGGTPDAIARRTDTGEIAVLDWKTSSGTYLSHVVQCAAYAILAEEAGIVERVDECVIVRVDKTGGAASVTCYGDSILASARKDFERRVASYHWGQSVRRVLRVR